MQLSNFFQLVSKFREVYTKKTFGEVVMLVAQGDPTLASRANSAIGTELDCTQDNKRIWNFVKHLGLN